MSKKIILFGWFMVVSVLLLSVINNQNMPLGFDHGPYKYFISLYESHGGQISQLSQTLRTQFEPFSGTFLSYLHTAIPDQFLFTWGYLGAHIFISILFFIIAKNNRKYSIGSLLGGLLLLLSSVQYGNYAGSLGKQIFATIFLLLSIRYNKKIFLNSIFLITCIALHRLTGFLAIIFSFFSLILTRKNNFDTRNVAFLGALFLGIIAYIPSFGFQVSPYLTSLTHNIADNIFIPGRYGSGFSAKNFWFLEIPLLLMVLLGVTYSHKKKSHPLLTSPYVLTFLVVTFFVVFRGIAHSRFQSFFDLFLLLIFIKHTYSYLSKKWIYTLLIIQSILWVGLFIHDHKSSIDIEEDKILQKIVPGIPDTVHLFSLSSGYRALMTGYGHRDFRDEYRHNLGRQTKNDTIRLSKDKKFLCDTLSHVNKEVFIYRGAQEKAISSIDNPCLQVIKKWSNGAQLMHYSKE